MCMDGWMDGLVGGWVRGWVGGWMLGLSGKHWQQLAWWILTAIVWHCQLPGRLSTHLTRVYGGDVKISLGLWSNKWGGGSTIFPKLPGFSLSLKVLSLKDKKYPINKWIYGHNMATIIGAIDQFMGLKSPSCQYLGRTGLGLPPSSRRRWWRTLVAEILSGSRHNESDTFTRWFLM